VGKTWKRKMVHYSPRDVKQERAMSENIPTHVQKQIDKMVDTFRHTLTEMYQWSNCTKSEHAPTAVEIEDKIRQWIQQIGEDVQVMLLGGMDRNRRKGKRCCPRCRRAVYWKRYEPRNYITSLGEMQLERAYYYHAACHCGWVPLDERLEIGASELSPRVREMVSYLGGFMPFEQAQAFLSKHCGIHISHDTVNNSTVNIGLTLKGMQVAAVRAAWEADRLPICVAANPPKRLYVSADGINHLLPDGQGKEIKVAAVYETEIRQTKQEATEVHAVDIEYVVHTNAEELARAAYLIAAQRGLETAEQIIVLGDGARWIWNRIATLFPYHKTTEILDFYHASEYIWDAGNTVFGKETPEAQGWGKQQCHNLKHKGPEPVLEALQALSPADKPSPQLVTKAITYFENQSRRMDYPAYIEQQLQIGSGSAESAVNQVVGVRINQAGMRWDDEHAEAVAHVRAAILSKRWDDFWADYSPPPRQYQRHRLPLAA
jgi:hypothetical protein